MGQTQSQRVGDVARHQLNHSDKRGMVQIVLPCRVQLLRASACRIPV